MDALKVNVGEPFFTSVKFKTTVESLMSTYDQIFICTNDKEALMGLMVVQTFNPGVVLLARLRKTQKDEMKKLLQIKQLMFYFMTKPSNIFAIFILALGLAACSKVLQNVELKVNVEDNSTQEEFNVVEKDANIQRSRPAK